MGIWLNGRGGRVTTITHEFGHNLRAKHSGAWVVDGDDPLSRDGEFWEYGDFVDVMGRSRARFPDNHFNTHWKHKFGWMEGAGNLAEPEDPHVTRLHAHDAGEDSYAEHRAYAVRLPKPARFGPDTSYWVEFRQSVYDEPGGNGVEIRLASPWRQAVGGGAGRDEDTILLNMGGGTGSPGEDWLLPQGERYVDEAAGFGLMPLRTGQDEAGNWWIDVYTGEPDLTAPTVGDFNLDGDVGQEDMAIMATHWGGSEKTWMQGDAAGDGRVGADDFELLTRH